MVRGETCPATRTSRAYDPGVFEIRATSPTNREGKRKCGTCGKIVPVSQPTQENYGAPLAAWYYGRHDA